MTVVDKKESWTDRTELLLGSDKMQRLRDAHVLVVGVGGVGAYAAEMLCRAGVGEMTLIDADTVQPTNINRQLPATHATLGRPKVEVLAERFRDINPEIKVHALPVYLTEELKIENLTVDILCTPDYENYAKAIISCWQKNIGVELNGTITVCEETEFHKKLASGEFDTAIYRMSLDSDSMAEFLSMFTADNEYNVLNYNSAEYNRIVKDLKANPTVDKATYAQSYLLKNAVLLPICTENSVFATAEDVSGIFFVGDRANIYFYKGQKQ